MHSRTVFFLGLLLAASGVVSPAIALAGGIAFGFTMEHPFRLESHSLAKLLLQISVVALGFGMNLKQVVHAGRSGFVYTAISISCAMLLGLLFGVLLKVAGKASFLISAGTAICGGSAIAAISPITGADEEEISVSMGTVFVLNSVALLIFPAIGHFLHLSQNQFGLWSALAIHDTSSVVGAAAKYGNQALGGRHHGKAGPRPLDCSGVVACGRLYGEVRRLVSSRPRSRFRGLFFCSVSRPPPPPMCRGSPLSMER